VRQKEADRVMVFANRRDIVRDLSENLKADGIPCQVLSGDVPQNKRIRTLDGFKEGKFEVLVATDVAGRGIHVDGVSHVINFTLPEDPEDYVHRIGRTGRAGKKGVSISFACEDDSFQIPAIEEYIKRKIDLEQLPDDMLTDEAAAAAYDAAVEAAAVAEAEEANKAENEQNEPTEAVVETESAQDAEKLAAGLEKAAKAYAESEEAVADVEAPVGEVTSVEVAESEEGPEITVEVFVQEDDAEAEESPAVAELSETEAQETDAAKPEQGNA
jgi:ATP-dependent RNA helicase RhlB